MKGSTTVDTMQLGKNKNGCEKLRRVRRHVWQLLSEGMTHLGPCTRRQQVSTRESIILTASRLTCSSQRKVKATLHTLF